MSIILRHHYVTPASLGHNGQRNTNRNHSINVALLIVAKASRGGIMMAQNIELFCQKKLCQCK
jgi:hypothetical protein